MRASTIVILLLLAVTFIPLDGINSSKFSVNAMESEAYVAFIVNETTANETNNDIVKCDCGGDGVSEQVDGNKTPCKCIADTGECKCSTSGQVITETEAIITAMTQNVDIKKPCECTECQCESCECTDGDCVCENCKKKQEVPLKASTNMPYVVYYIGATWCSPCRTFKRDQLYSNSLKDKGYNVMKHGSAKEGSAHIVELDFDKDREYIQEKFGELPESVPHFIGYDESKNEIYERFSKAGVTWQELTKIYMRGYKAQGYE